MSIGERISALRKEKRLTQENLAEMLDVTRQTISKWELDQSTPEIEYICKLSDIFEVTTDHLIKGVREGTGSEGREADAVETAETTEAAEAAEQADRTEPSDSPWQVCHASAAESYESQSKDVKKGACTVGLVLTVIGGILLLGGVIGLMLESDYSAFLLWGSVLFVVAGLELMLIKKNAAQICLWSLWALVCLPVGMLMPLGAIAYVFNIISLIWLAMNIIVTAVYIARHIRAGKKQP